MQFLVAQVIAVCTMLGMAEPKTMKEYVEVGVGYQYTISPADQVLTRKELDHWMALLVASDDQVHAISALYEAYVSDRHNPYLDREIPDFLAKAAGVASLYESHGVHSMEYEEAILAVDRLAIRLTHMVEQLELHFVESLEPILAPEQIDTLFILRLQTLRRKCSSLTRAYRWLELELRDVCAALPETVLTVDDAHTIQAQLLLNEDELTMLLRHWVGKRLDSGRRIRRHLHGVARGAVEPDHMYLAREYRQSADVARRIRLLQMTTLEDLLTNLSSDAADQLRTIAQERIFPELYPDPLHRAVTDMLNGVINDAEMSSDVRGIATISLEFYRNEYAEICRRLEALCIEWDDGMHIDTNEYHPNYLPHALSPILEERAQMSRETMRRFEEEREYREGLREQAEAVRLGG